MVDSAKTPEEMPESEDSVTFKGGIHVRGVVGGTGVPFGGHLRIGNEHIRLWGLGFDISSRRDAVQAIKFSPGVFVRRISVVPIRQSSIQMLWFSTGSPEPVRAALVARGWTVIDDDDFALGVSETDET